MNEFKRIVEIEIGGNTYPLCLTLSVYDSICGRYKSLRGCVQRLDDLAGRFERNPETNEITVIVPEQTEDLITEYLWLLDALVVGGFAVQGLQDLPKMPKYWDVFCPGDVPYIQSKVLEAIRVGQMREVGTQAPKNGAGADGAPAPER